MNDPTEPGKLVVASFLVLMVILTSLWVYEIGWALFFR
jgi:hypothetical protein